MNEVEEKFKNARPNPQDQAQTLGQCATGSIGSKNSQYQPNLQDRISEQLYMAQKNATKLENLKELKYLLDKNPEVTRILSLLELVGI